MPRHPIRRLIFQIPLVMSFSGAMGNPVAEKARMQRRMEQEHARQQQIQQRNDSLRLVKLRQAYDVLKIDREPDACLVFRIDNGRCQLDVRAFNRMVDTHMQITALAEIDSISWDSVPSRRMAIVEPWLESAYLEHMRESAADRERVASDSRKEVEKSVLEGSGTFGDSLLRSLYHAHANRFRGGTRLRLDILASTDSSLIDSLHSAFPAKAGGREAEPPESPGSIRPYSITLVQEGGKPIEPAGFEDLFLMAKDAVPDTWIRIPPRRFGHVLLRVRSRDSLPPVRFHEAKPLLSYLARYPDSGASEKPIEDAELLAYYEANRAYFLYPDTLYFKAWLWPLQAAAHARGDSSVDRAMDTGSIAPLMLTQFDFPTPLRTWVYENFRCCAGDRWSPSGLPYGKWTFQLRKIVKGKGTKPFSAVRDSLLGIHRSIRDPYLQAEKVLLSKTRTREQYFWREKILEDLRTGREGFAEHRDPTPSNRDGKKSDLAATGSAIEPRHPDNPWREYQQGIRHWVSESLDLGALKE